MKIILQSKRSEKFENTKRNARAREIQLNELQQIESSSIQRL